MDDLIRDLVRLGGQDLIEERADLMALSSKARIGELTSDDLTQMEHDLRNMRDDLRRQRAEAGWEV